MQTGHPGKVVGPRPIPFLLPAVFLLVLGSARAIPAFSRKYKTSCNTCHVAFPMLNDFGEAFRRNGFQFPQDDDWFVKDKAPPVKPRPRLAGKRGDGRRKSRPGKRPGRAGPPPASARRKRGRPPGKTEKPQRRQKGRAG